MFLIFQSMEKNPVFIKIYYYIFIIYVLCKDLSTLKQAI